MSHVAALADFADRYLEAAEQALAAGNLSWEQFYFLRGNWSRKQFGERSERGPVGPLKHLLKEVEKELLPAAEVCPNRYAAKGSAELLLLEYVDVQFLLWDALDRNGFTLNELLAACGRKLIANRERKWQKPASPDQAVEHVRTLYEYKVIEEYADEAPDDFGFHRFAEHPKVGDVVMLKWLDGRDAYQVRVTECSIQELKVRVAKV